MVIYSLQPFTDPIGFSNVQPVMILAVRYCLEGIKDSGSRT